MAQPDESIVTIDHVSFQYQQDNVLEDINLTIRKGDFVGLIGPNGSGKTTLLKIMLGLLQPTQGNVSLFGTPISSFYNWEKIGYVPQKAGSLAVQFPITVEEIVSLGLRKKGHMTALSALASVGMDRFKSRLITELSGGQQQRVFIAKALVSKPHLLILDEPTVGVDIESQSTFYELLKELNHQHNLTLILVSHDIDVVSQEVKTVACINKTLLFHGKPKDFHERHVMETLYGSNVRYVLHQHESL